MNNLMWKTRCNVNRKTIKIFVAACQDSSTSLDLSVPAIASVLQSSFFTSSLRVHATRRAAEMWQWVCRGMRQDLRARWPLYISDWRDGLHIRVFCRNRVISPFFWFFFFLKGLGSYRVYVFYLSPTCSRICKFSNWKNKGQHWCSRGTMIERSFGHLCCLKTNNLICRLF